MITRDFILRQIHQLVQAVARVLLHRQAGEHIEAQQAIAGSVQQVTGTSLERVRGLSRDDTLALCTMGGALNGELATALADLLREDDDAASLLRALWLYEAVSLSGGTVPYDIHDRVAALRDQLGTNGATGTE